MATDATGTPTTLGIPKYNSNVDAPSGLGFNAAMDAIDALIAGRISKSTMTTVGDLLYASGASTPARLAIGSAGQVLTVSGGLPTWAAASAQGELLSQEFATDQATSSTTFVDLFTFAAATFEASKYYLEIVIPNSRHSLANAVTIFQFMEGASPIGNPINFDQHATASTGVSCVARIPFTPTAGSHTYKIQWKTSSGTSTIRTTSIAPAEFRIVKA